MRVILRHQPRGWGMLDGRTQGGTMCILPRAPETIVKAHLSIFPLVELMRYTGFCGSSCGIENLWRQLLRRPVSENESCTVNIGTTQVGRNGDLRPLRPSCQLNNLSSILPHSDEDNAVSHQCDD